LNKFYVNAVGGEVDDNIWYPPDNYDVATCPPLRFPQINLKLDCDLFIIRRSQDNRLFAPLARHGPGVLSVDIVLGFQYFKVATNCITYSPNEIVVYPSLAPVT